MSVLDFALVRLKQSLKLDYAARMVETAIYHHTSPFASPNLDADAAMSRRKIAECA